MMRIFTTFYNPEKEETTINISNEFLALHGLAKANALKDCLFEVQKLYESEKDEYFSKLITRRNSKTKPKLKLIRIK